MKPVLTVLFVVVLTATSQFVNAQAPAVSWQKCLGGSGDDYVELVKGVIRLNNGDYLTWGTTNSSDGSFPINKGGYDAYLVRLSQNGTIIWKKTYGGSADDIFYDVVQDGNAGFVAIGRTSSNNYDVSGNHGGDDAWLVRVNPNGNMIGQHCFGGSGDEGKFGGIARLHNGSIIFSTRTSSTDGDVVGKHGGEDGWIVRLNPAGHKDWAKCVGGTYSDDFSGTISIINNQIVVGGTTASDDGNITGFHGIGGTTNESGDAEGDAYIVRMTLAGALISAKCYGGSRGESYHTYTKALDGNIVICGLSLSNDGDIIQGGNPDLFLWAAKINLTADTVTWSWSSPETDLSAGFGIFTTSNGSFVAVGAIAPIFDWYTWDNYAVKLSATGSMLWKERFGGSDGDALSDGLELPDGSMIVAGVTTSNDGVVSGNHGGVEDSWIAKLSAGPQVNSTARLIAPNPAFNVYPNPLSAQATFSFSIPEAGNVSIDVIDVTGRIVQKVCNEIYENGPHEIVWNTAGISSGSYYVRFRTANSEQTITLSVIK